VSALAVYLLNILALCVQLKTHCRPTASCMYNWRILDRW